MKICPRCHETKEYSAFSRRKNRPGQVQGYCKACKAEIAREKKYYVAANAKVYATTRVLARELKKKLVDKKGGCCSRCGYDEFMSGLDFHHVGEKTDTVSSMTVAACRGSERHMELLLQEVEQCIILCKNCHMSLHGGEWEL